ncbi:hypothetical protein FPSE5266_20152, partial [Fusarium pseudograminearum]
HDALEYTHGQEQNEVSDKTCSVCKGQSCGFCKGKAPLDTAAPAFELGSPDYLATQWEEYLRAAEFELDCGDDEMDI